MNGQIEMPVAEFRRRAGRVLGDIDAALRRSVFRAKRLDISLSLPYENRPHIAYQRSACAVEIRSLRAQALDARMLVLRAKPTTYAEVLTALRRKVHVVEWVDVGLQSRD